MGSVTFCCVLLSHFMWSAVGEAEEGKYVTKDLISLIAPLWLAAV